MRRTLRPDWASMKETAYLGSEQDAELMAGVAKNMGTHLKQNTERTSLEEEVAKLQERHKLLHGPRKSNSERVSTVACYFAYIAFLKPPQPEFGILIYTSTACSASISILWGSFFSLRQAPFLQAA